MPFLPFVYPCLDRKSKTCPARKRDTVASTSRAPATCRLSKGPSTADSTSGTATTRKENCSGQTGDRAFFSAPGWLTAFTTWTGASTGAWKEVSTGAWAGGISALTGSAWRQQRTFRCGAPWCAQSLSTRNCRRSS